MDYWLDRRETGRNPKSQTPNFDWHGQSFASSFILLCSRFYLFDANIDEAIIIKIDLVIFVSIQPTDIPSKTVHSPELVISMSIQHTDPARLYKA